MFFAETIQHFSVFSAKHVYSKVLLYTFGTLAVCDKYVASEARGSLSDPSGLGGTIIPRSKSFTLIIHGQYLYQLPQPQGRCGSMWVWPESYIEFNGLSCKICCNLWIRYTTYNHVIISQSLKMKRMISCQPFFQLSYEFLVFSGCFPANLEPQPHPCQGTSRSAVSSSGGSVDKSAMKGCIHKPETRWWQLKYFLCSPRTLGKWSNLTTVFSTTN